MEIEEPGMDLIHSCQLVNNLTSSGISLTLFNEISLLPTLMLPNEIYQKS